MGSRNGAGEQGFTLIELLVVVIIIGILASIAIPSLMRQRESAWRAQIQSDLHMAAIAMESYYSENRRYDEAALADATYGYSRDSQGTQISIDVPIASQQQFCVVAAHDQLPDTWQIGSNIRLSPGDCT